MTVKQQIEVLVSDAEHKIAETRELISIMEMAGEDLTEEKSELAELETRVARYRAALDSLGK